MCGIAGLIQLDRTSVDVDSVRRMTNTLRHRGPDGEGLETPAPWVALGHRRLSIIDLDGGRQPLANEDGSVWITYNGEIFNYRQLRRELEGRGHQFRTQSDTEVIVHLYEEMGAACVERLSGQFAFVIWDGERLFCARDPLGIKPLYFFRDRSRFAFASEPRAFSALAGFDPEIDLEGVHLYMQYRFIPAPKSALKGVEKLCAGEWLTLESSGRLQRQRYWNLERDAIESLTDVESASEELRARLKECVTRQMVADVDVGAFLSGGLDSSAIVAFMAEEARSRVHTFSIGFEEPKYDERRFADEVAREVGTQHNVEVFDTRAARGVIESVLDHVDEPFGDTAILPTFAVSKLAQRSVKVVLSGDGGDELFAGYGRYFRALHLLAIPPPCRPLWWLWRRLQAAPRDVSKWRYADGPAVDDLYHRFLIRMHRRELAPLYGAALRPELNRNGRHGPVGDLISRLHGLPPLSRLLAIDLHSILSEYHLVKVDRASMQTSLEVRVPFLDLAFVRFAFQLSSPLKLYGDETKGLMRHALRSDLPPSVLSRRKRGFGPPLSYWFAGGLQEFVRERLEDAHVVREGLLERRAIDATLTPRRGKLDGSKLWRILVLESWLRNLRGGRLAATTS